MERAKEGKDEHVMCNGLSTQKSVKRLITFNDKLTVCVNYAQYLRPKSSEVENKMSLKPY